MYSLSLHYKEKHEKSMGTCFRPTIPLGWQLSGRQLSWVAVVLSGSCPRWQLSGAGPAGGPVVPGPPFEIGAPISRLAHLLLHTSNTVFSKCAPPYGFWPLLVFGPPPAASSWRRAWSGADPVRKFRGGDFSNIWQTSLSWQPSVFPNCTKSW